MVKHLPMIFILTFAKVGTKCPPKYTRHWPHRTQDFATSTKTVVHAQHTQVHSWTKNLTCVVHLLYIQVGKNVPQRLPDIALAETISGFFCPSAICMYILEEGCAISTTSAWQHIFALPCAFYFCRLPPEWERRLCANVWSWVLFSNLFLFFLGRTWCYVTCFLPAFRTGRRRRRIQLSRVLCFRHWRPRCIVVLPSV